MTDPLSVATGIAGLISLGIQVTQSLVQFYTSYKGLDGDVARITGNLESLHDIFEFLQSALETRTFRRDEQDLIKNIESSISKCSDLIQELQEEWEKFDKCLVSGIKGAIKAAGRRTAYPFRQSTLQKLDEDIRDIRDDLRLALDVLQLGDNKATQDDIVELKSLVEIMRATQISSTIRDWLKAPDATVNHNAACAKRHPGTGTWLVKSPIFTNWLTRGNSFLWINGFAGCGKSVLCSTAIQYTFRYKRSDHRTAIAFFYFTFNNEAKQSESAMLQALILQLSGQSSDSRTDLSRLRESHNTGMPPAIVLLAYLQRLIQNYFGQVYILLDALDESPLYGQRDNVLKAIQTMRNWLLPGLHLLVTSRDEPDIRDSLIPAGDEEVIMKNDEINRDINNFIAGHLNTNSKLRKLHEYHDQIQQVLAERAQGVFRWVECQFEALKRCPRSEDRLKKCLRSLPRSLDETYERILRNIDEDSREEAARILTLLCFSSRPLTVQELIDGIAVDLQEPARLNPRRRLQDIDDLRKICPGLIDIGFEANDKLFPKNGGNDSEEETTLTLRIAHFSVQEYLESDRIKLHRFALKSAFAHAEIAQICLVYLQDCLVHLQEPGLPSGKTNIMKLREYPLAYFAAQFWHYHYNNATDTVSQLDRLVLALFQQRQDTFCTCMRLQNPERLGDPLTSDMIASPIYYASCLGLDGVLRELISHCQNHASMANDLINAEGGRHKHALTAASSKGHEKILQILIDAGADVNAENGAALRVASDYGYEKAVQLLIDAGANVNAGEPNNTALWGASYGGYEKAVQLLIDAGANVNAGEEPYATALWEASSKGQEKVVQILIDAGADVNAGEPYATALWEASSKGQEKVVQILIDAGADVNAENGAALWEASLYGYEKVVQILIDAGADVNAANGAALWEASDNGYEKVVQILLDAGADVNAVGTDGTALQAASDWGHEEVVQILLDAGAVEE